MQCLEVLDTGECLYFLMYIFKPMSIIQRISSERPSPFTFPYFLIIMEVATLYIESLLSQKSMPEFKSNCNKVENCVEVLHNK